MKNSVFFCLSSVILAITVSGCAEFDYIGRTFDPLDEGSVAWHTADNPVPAGKYRVIGRGTLKFRTGKLDKYDIEERLISEAEKIGADAVMLKKTVQTEVAAFDVDSSVDTAKSPERQPQIAKTADGSELEINSLGGPVDVKGSKNSSTDVTVYAVFYKKSAAVQRMIESQRVRVMDKSGEVRK